MGNGQRNKSTHNVYHAQPRVHLVFPLLREMGEWTVIPAAQSSPTATTHFLSYVQACTALPPFSLQARRARGHDYFGFCCLPMKLIVRRANNNLYVSRFILQSRKAMPSEARLNYVARGKGFILKKLQRLEWCLLPIRIVVLFDKKCARSTDTQSSSLPED